MWLEIPKYIAFIAIYSSNDRGLNERCRVTSLHSLIGKSGMGALVGLLLHEPPMTFEDRAMMKLFDHRQLIATFIRIEHVNEYPIMLYFGIPRDAQSMIAYKILTECFWNFQS